MSAPVARIPSPRRPLGPTAPGVTSVPTPRVTPEGRHRSDAPRADAPRADAPRSAAPDVPAPRRNAPDPAPRPAGRHRRPAPPFTPVTRTFTVLARAGSLTTLAAMVVLAAAVAGLADGTPPTGAAAGIAVSSLDR